MERMSKEKESGTLLGVGTAYFPVKEIKGEFYVKASDFNRCMDGIRIEQEADRKHIEELEEENKKLKEKYDKLDKVASENVRTLDELEAKRIELEEENKELKEGLSKNKIERWSLKKDCENKIEQQKIALKSMENQIRELKETLEHRDSVLSIMYDLLRSDLSDYEQLCMIDVVIDVEVGNEPQNKLREGLLDRFWKRDF